MTLAEMGLFFCVNFVFLFCFVFFLPFFMVVFSFSPVFQKVHRE